MHGHTGIMSERSLGSIMGMNAGTEKLGLTREDQVPFAHF